MEISKEQPLRPYVQELGDAFSSTIGVFNKAMIAVSDEIEATGSSITAANIVYDEPFNNGVETFVLYGLVSNYAGLTLVLTEHDERGFTLNIVNDNVESFTVKVGYMVLEVE